MRERANASSKQRVPAEAFNAPCQEKNVPRGTIFFADALLLFFAFGDGAASNARQRRTNRSKQQAFAQRGHCANKTLFADASKKVVNSQRGGAGTREAFTRAKQQSESGEERERNANARSRLRSAVLLKASCVRSRSLKLPLSSERRSDRLQCLRCGSSSEKRSGMRGGFGVGAGGERELCARSKRGDCRDTPCLRGTRGREGGRDREPRRHYGVYGVSWAGP